MKKLVILIALSTTVIFASSREYDLNIANFSGEYVEPLGTGEATSFQGVSSLLNKIAISIEKISDEAVKVNFQNNEVVFEGLPPSLFDMKEVKWNNFNLGQHRGNISLSLDSIMGKTLDESTYLNRLEAFCLMANRNYRNGYEKLLVNCTKQGSLKLAKYTSSNKSSTLISSFFNKYFNSPQANVSDISNLNLSITNNNLNLSAKIKAGISAKVKGKGKIWYLKPSKEIKLEIKSLKAGFISVKNQVFKELESSNDPNIRVERPYVYYKVDTK